MTFREILDKIKSEKLRVNNLFEIDGGWQANLIDPEKEAYEFGRGLTPEQALQSALLKCKRGSGIPLKKQEVTYVQGPAKTAKVEFRLLTLDELGLGK